MLVIRLNQMYWKFSLNLQILLDMSLTNDHFSEVQVLHLLPNESDSTYCSQGGPGTLIFRIQKSFVYIVDVVHSYDTHQGRDVIYEVYFFK